MKNIIIILLIIVLVGLGIYYFTQRDTAPGTETTVTETDTETATTSDETPKDTTQTVIGRSVEGRDITAYHYGTGDDEVLFVGGIHGGYEWNTVLVAYQLMDYLAANPSIVPANVTATVVPVLNPDGLEKTVGTDGRFTATDVPSDESERIAGRFNAHTVDLNRNFDCDWQANATWQSTSVSGGTSAFSEPEAKAIRDYVRSSSPKAVVVWYSAAGGVFASSCHNGVLPETASLTSIFADASGYKPYESFDFYAVTGDMVNWLAKEGIPAISVLLTDHENTEWSKNRGGVEAVLKHYAK